MMVARVLGATVIKSAAFELERRGDVYHFDGHGYGHGVGMCVTGSMNLAARGQTATQILNRYYPGLDIIPYGQVSAPEVSQATAPTARTVPVLPPRAASAASISSPLPSGVDVKLPAGDDSDDQRAAIATLAAHARDEIAAELRVPPPARLSIRVHPSTDSYERATGQPWFTSGTVVAGELHLLPLSTLRERGVLERTIRRELVHVMIDEPLAARPAWVRAGAALYFSGGRPEAAADQDSQGRPTVRTLCPDDVELQQPVSAGSFSNAYARALACFAREAGRGRSWKDVK